MSTNLRSLDDVANECLGILIENREYNASAQKRLAIILATEFVQSESPSHAVARVKSIVDKMREIVGKEDWRRTKANYVSMITKVLALSGTRVASEWCVGKFDVYPIQSTYRALNKYDAKGNRKRVVQVEEKMLKYFRTMSKKHGAEVVISAYSHYMHDDGRLNDVSEVVANIDPFASSAKSVDGVVLPNTVL